MQKSNISQREILNALKKKQFQVLYQPKIDMETSRLTGMEALLRWTSNTGTSLSPDIFIPLAEEYNIITSITLYVLETVCQDLCEWKKKHLNIIPISVNLSRVDLCKLNFVQQLFNILDMYRIEYEYIQLELTETAFVKDYDKIVEGLQLLRAQGIRIAIDDFGTGYSSFLCLKTLPIDIMKIDRLFLRDITEDIVTQNILRSILDLARGLNLEVVYEGVETKDQADYLKHFEFKIAQGFYYALPMRKKEIECWLKKQ